MSPSTEHDIVHPYVEGLAGVHGGRPVIKGTRFPVSSIVQNHRRGCTAEEIVRDFPHLTHAQAYDALSYYYLLRPSPTICIGCARAKQTTPCKFLTSIADEFVSVVLIGSNRTIRQFNDAYTFCAGS